MHKVDCEANEWVANELPIIYTAITRAIAGCEEDFSVGDIHFSALTSNGELKGYDLENKRIMAPWQIKYEESWNPYFTEQIYSKIRFDQDITSGAPIYFVNAVDKFGKEENGKWQKLLKANACLCYFALDGLLLFSPRELREAFLGYGDYYVKHTTLYGDKVASWEKKSLLDLRKGTYVQLSPPKELFIK